ncbi:mitochondrial chaperone [Blyttiomyces sp. JEL0837]|nr:mitochondrial chaperone [Blyttiomyces sp. JEL0837]
MRGVETVLGENIVSIAIAGFALVWFYRQFARTYTAMLRMMSSEVILREGDESFDNVSRWFSNNPSKLWRVNNFVVQTAYKQNETMKDDNGPPYIKRKPLPGARPSLVYSPDIGAYKFTYKSTRINVRFSHESDDPNEPSVTVPRNQQGGGIAKQLESALGVDMPSGGDSRVIRLSCFGWNAGRLKAFISYCMELAHEQDANMTPIYSIAHVRLFLTSEDFYKRCGVPFRRGYLLHGPPGCGKTSFILALAGELGLGISIIHLSSSTLSDGNLASLLSAAPGNIILMEDIDVALAPPTTEASAPASPARGRMGFGGPSTGITLSGLLNALDGIVAQEKRMVFMTTNNIDALPAALLRPGRVDRRFLFDHADQDVAFKMFVKFRGPDMDSVDDVFADLDEKLKLDGNRFVEALLSSEANLTPNDEVVKEDVSKLDMTTTTANNGISPALIQGFLMQHRFSTVSEIVDALPEWKRVRKANAKKPVADTVSKGSSGDQDSTEQFSSGSKTAKITDSRAEVGDAKNKADAKGEQQIDDKTKELDATSTDVKAVN